MSITLEHLSVELLYEIFTYFQFHEVYNIFSNLNSRFAIIIRNMTHMPVYVGLNGMSIALTEFYYKHLLQPNICNRLISLCVSDTLAIGNGLWLASHVSKFINLRHLSLIDIQRSSFELFLSSLSPMKSLIIFSIRFSTEYRAIYTFVGVPEGAYHERIFHLFPSLCVCHLLFVRYIHSTLDDQLILPPNKSFIPIQTNLSNLRSLTLQCSTSFLSYLFEYLPQLEQLSYIRTVPWLPEEHPLRHENKNQIIPINKHLAPNLRRLHIYWNGCIVSVKSMNQLFEHDVLFSLMKFRLLAGIARPDVLQDVLSMLSNQCLYSFDVYWSIRDVVSLSDTNKILSDTFQQLKQSLPIELELSLKENKYFIRAVTVPRMDQYLDVDSYLHENTMYGQSHWSHNRRSCNTQLFYCNKIIMRKDYDQINDKFLSFSPPLISWHQITSLDIEQPFNSTHLHCLFSKLINLRTLELHYELDYGSKIDLNEEIFINLLNDSSLCKMLMSNGLRKLILFVDWKPTNLLNIAYLIVERLPNLQILELDGISTQLIEMSHILINGLSKLRFFTLTGRNNHGKLYDKRLRDLQDSNTRSFRTEVPKTIDENMLFVWL